MPGRRARKEQRPEGAVFEGLFGRAKSPPPEAKCPEGEKARAAGPGKNNARRAERNILISPGRRPKKNISEKPRPGGQKETF